MSSTYYPASPANSSTNLTALTQSYMLRASLAILSIVVFFILYSALVSSFAYLTYHAVIYDMGRVNKFTILLKIGAIAGSAMLFVFTLKFIFKLKNHKPTNRIEVSKDNYPELWDFVYKICQETGAPRPKSIYVDPDVNAYVSYTNTWLSLFLPVSKDLTIGLGLVSCLNLSEFKAVISHEFGHFAQKSMKIGSYIMSANTIIHDMIFSRDKWDELLTQWRGADIRLSAAAWVITPIIWLIRQMLNLFYQFLNIMYSSLSREMEFNADKVAVKTTGSDAIISGLWKLDGGSENWNSTINSAYLAAQKKLFSQNLYLHHLMAIERGAEQQRQLLNNLPEDSRGGKQYFSTSENSKVGMYASHPPNDKREENAKVPHYVKCEQDQRSPWLLFGNQKETLQQEMTGLIYQKLLNKTPDTFVLPAAFEKFIIDENHGKELLMEYDNNFHDRFMTIPAIEQLQKHPVDTQHPKAAIDQLKKDLALLMAPVKEIEALMQKVQNIAEGTAVEKSFSFMGAHYNKKNLNEGYQVLTEQREKLYNETFKEWDEAFCAFYYHLAKLKQQHEKISNLYIQHTAITKFYKAVVTVKNMIYKELHAIQSKEDLTQEELNNFGNWVNTTFTGLNDELKALDEIAFVPMPNIESVSELKEAIIEGGWFKEEVGIIFENGGFDHILTQIDSTLSHCQRLDQKSIGVILAFHKELE